MGEVKGSPEAQCNVSHDAPAFCNLPCTLDAPAQHGLPWPRYSFSSPGVRTAEHPLTLPTPHPCLRTDHLLEFPSELILLLGGGRVHF